MIIFRVMTLHDFCPLIDHVLAMILQISKSFLLQNKILKLYSFAVTTYNRTVSHLPHGV